MPGPAPPRAARGSPRPRACVTPASAATTGGSIRFPSASCGVVGIKPTWGRVSRYGVLALAESLDHVGPMTRSTADAGIVLQAIAGADANDPTSLPDPVPDMLQGIGQGVAGLRFGFDERYATDEVDPELAQAVLDSVKLLGELGGEIVEVRLPPLEEYLAAWPVLCTAEAALAHEATYPSRRDEYGPWFMGWLDQGAAVTGVDYARANNLRAACNGHIRDAFAGIDVLVTPSMPSRAFPVADLAPFDPLPEEGLDMGLLRFTAPFDFNGAPTLSVPCGLSSDGLPLSLQFVGKHLQEPLLCRIGCAYEQATEWARPAPAGLAVFTPARRGAKARGTLADRRERVGVRCGGPAPLRVATGRAQPEPKHRFGRWRRPATSCGAGCRKTRAFDQWKFAWRAGPPYRIPALGAGTKHLFRTR